MLVILEELVNEIVEIAHKASPFEVCGVISGPENSNTPLRHIPMVNIAKSESFFQFDSKEQLRVWREMEKTDEEPVVIYHSHTNSRAYPSKEDVAFAQEPRTHYVIIPTNPKFDTDVRSFRIVDGRITEERIQIVKDYSLHSFNMNKLNAVGSNHQEKIA